MYPSRPQVTDLTFAHLHWPTHFLINLKAKLLHGEQFLSIKAPIPTSGNLVNETRYVRALPCIKGFHFRTRGLTLGHRIIEVLDKGKAAAVTMQVTTKDKTGTVIFENQSTVFIRGSGGFGGKRVGKGKLSRTWGCYVEKFTRLTEYIYIPSPGSFLCYNEQIEDPLRLGTSHPNARRTLSPRKRRLVRRLRCTG